MKKLFTTLFIGLAGLMTYAQPAITRIEYMCDSAILYYNSSAPISTYYWQGTSCGTSTLDNSSSYMAKASGVYYLRAMTTAWIGSSWFDTWTLCASTTVTLGEYPDTPPVLTLSGNQMSIGTPPTDITYYWQGYTCGNNTDLNIPTISVAPGNTYYVRAFDSTYNCWSVDCSNKYVPYPLAIDLIKGNNDGVKIVLSPNPVYDKVQISLPNELKKVDLVIFDMGGRTVYSKNNVSDNEVLDISRLNSGTYLARFKANGQLHNQMFYKSK